MLIYQPDPDQGICIFSRGTLMKGGYRGSVPVVLLNYGFQEVFRPLGQISDNCQILSTCTGQRWCQSQRFGGRPDDAEYSIQGQGFMNYKKSLNYIDTVQPHTFYCWLNFLNFELPQYLKSRTTLQIWIFRRSD